MGTNWNCYPRYFSSSLCAPGALYYHVGTPRAIMAAVEGVLSGEYGGYFDFSYINKFWRLEQFSLDFWTHAIIGSYYNWVLEVEYSSGVWYVRGYFLSGYNWFYWQGTQTPLSWIDNQITGYSGSYGYGGRIKINFGAVGSNSVKQWDS